MSAHEDFVLNLMGWADFVPTEEITPETASVWMNYFEDDQIPDGLTPELFADIYNSHLAPLED